MTVLTKTAQRAIGRQLRDLRTERRRWLAGRYVPWGAPWCTGPASPFHQEGPCEGCGTVAWCRRKADEVGAEIQRLEAMLAPAVQGALW